MADVKLAFRSRISRSRSYVNRDDEDDVDATLAVDTLVPVSVAVFLALRAVDGGREDCGILCDCADGCCIPSVRVDPSSRVHRVAPRRIDLG